MSKLHGRIYSYVSAKQEQEEKDEITRTPANTILPGDRVYVKVFRRKWFHPRREGPFLVTRCTGTALQVEGSPTWYHLNHCVKAPPEGEDNGAARGGDLTLPGLSQDEGDNADMVQPAGPPTDMEDPDNDDSGRFDSVDCQFIPATPHTDSRGEDTSPPGGGGIEPNKTGSGPNDTGEESDVQSLPGLGRPVRTKRRPQKYNDYA